MCCLAEWGIFQNFWYWKQDIIPSVIKKYLKKSVPTSSASSPHDSAFDDLILKIKPELEDGTVFDMNQVFQMYQEFS